MKVETKLLSRVLDVNSRNLPATHVIPYFQNILFEVKDNKCTIVTGDEVSEIATYIQVEEADDHRFCIDGKSFIDTVKLIDEEFITITIKGKSALIKAGKSKFKLPCLEPSHFPRLITSETDYTNVPNEIIKHFEKVNGYINPKDSRPVLTGVNLVTKGNKLMIQGSDSFVFFNAELPVDQEVPSGTINKRIVDVIGAFREAIQINYAVDGKCVILKDGSITIKVRLIDGNFPNISPFLEAPRKNRIVANKQKLLKALKRAMIYTSLKSKMVILEFDSDSNTIKVYAEHVELSKKSVEIFEPESFSSESYKLGVNGLFLQNLINTIDSENIALENASPKAPLFVTDEDGISGIDCFMAPMSI